MKKRGQFYLVAALVIIAVIASLTVVYNETKPSDKDLVIYDLSNEINFEILQLLDSGYFNALTPAQLNSSINSIVESYSATPSITDLVLIYGDNNKVNVIAYYLKDSGTACGAEGGCTRVVERTFESKIVYVTAGSILFTMNNVSYNFNVEQYGQNFYLVLKNTDPTGQIFLTGTGCLDSGCLNNKICNSISNSCEPCGKESEPCCLPNNQQDNGCNGALNCGNDGRCKEEEQGIDD